MFPFYGLSPTVGDAPCAWAPLCAEIPSRAGLSSCPHSTQSGPPHEGEATAILLSACLQRLGQGEWFVQGGTEPKHRTSILRVSKDLMQGSAILWWPGQDWPVTTRCWYRTRGERLKSKIQEGNFGWSQSKTSSPESRYRQDHLHGHWAGLVVMVVAVMVAAAAVVV